MIITWMFAAMALTLLLGAAALAAEWALRATGRQGRLPWIVALVAALTWPVIAPFAAAPTVQTLTVRTLSEAAGTVAVAPPASVDALALWLTRLATLDRPLVLLWAIASLLLLGRVAWAVAALRRVAECAPAAVLDDTEVRVTTTVGPAVFAVWRAHLLLPDWLLDLDPPLRRLVLAHEREHMRARDAQLIVASFVAVALMPWNAVLWWLAKRLRTASELDCDARVLHGGADAQTYGHLLILIAQRQGHARFLPMMAGAPSTLRARIIAMSTPRPRRPLLRAALLSIAAALLVAATANPTLARPLASVRIREFFAPSAAPAAAAALRSPQAQQSQQAQPAKAPAKPKGDSAKRVLDAKVVKPAVAAPSKTAADTIAKKAAADATLKPAKEFKEFKLDDQATLRPGAAAPRYPEILKQAGVTGSTLVMFVVDTSGNVDEGTLKVVRTAHPLFVDAVKASLPALKFYPARVDNRPVKQLVQMMYRFATTSHPAFDSTQALKDVRAFEIVITGVDEAMPARGLGGLGNTQAIYIVDGKRASKADVGKIPTDRIVSVEVFKGETARAKYGDEGKNGVIVITTKP